MFWNKKKRKRKNPRPRKKTKTSFGQGIGKILQIIFPWVGGLLLIAVIVIGVKQYFLNAPLFEISNVEFEILGGRSNINQEEFAKKIRKSNIFTVDLKKYEHWLKVRHREIEEINLVKEYPDTVVVEIKTRKPALQALIGGAYYLIDDESVVIQGPSSYAGQSILRVDGIESALKNYIGQRYDSYRLKKAMELSDILQKTGLDEDLNIISVDTGTTENIIIHIEGGVEIKMGNTAFAERLKLLRQAMKQMSIDPEKIKYIDLRFENIIIGSR